MAKFQAKETWKKICGDFTIQLETEKENDVIGDGKFCTNCIIQGLLCFSPDHLIMSYCEKEDIF